MLHFAPRYGIVSPCLTWGSSHARKPVLRKPANDNGAAIPGQHDGANDDISTRDEALLEAALRMFAAHGLSAALRACEAAEIAAAGGDRAGAAWWLDVCATFDRTLAKTASRAFVTR